MAQIGLMRLSGNLLLTARDHVAGEIRVGSRSKIEASAGTARGPKQLPYHGFLLREAGCCNAIKTYVRNPQHSCGLRTKQLLESK
jgi:hypothetical protein